MANPLVDALLAAVRKTQNVQPMVDPNAGVDVARPWDSAVLKQQPPVFQPPPAPVPAPAPVQPGDDAAALLRLLATRNREIARNTGNPYQQAQ